MYSHEFKYLAIKVELLTEFFGKIYLSQIRKLITRDILTHFII